MDRHALGKYQLTEKVGSGGMGVVYRGEVSGNPHPVAVKVLHANMASEEDMVSRFRNEAKTIRQLDHPNIVRFLDGPLDEDGLVYFVMEFAEGEGLNEILKRRGRLPLDQIVRVSTQVCAAMGHAHKKNVVHRDLKPSNIKIGIDNVVKIMDFGIAKVMDSSVLTSMLTLKGTVEYMSPEQCQEGVSEEKESDIYSFGIILYEMVTGEVPFSSQYWYNVLRQHMEEKPRNPRQLNAHIPEELDVCIMKCLEKDPAKRFSSMEELGKAVEESVSKVSADDTVLGCNQVIEGRYRLDKRLTHKGQCTVYRGMDLTTGETVAVKLLPWYMSDNAEYRERLKREAHTLERLTHNHIVKFRSKLMTDDNIYVVIEWVEGKTLSELIGTDAPLPLIRVRNILRQTCAALTYLHNNNIVHRDIKGSNIMVGSNDRVTLLDFGIVRLPDSKVTTMGQVIGTPKYMSPEQCRGERVDVRSDVYSLGILVFEMLTGSFPYKARSTDAYMKAHCQNEPLRCTKANGDLPRGLDRWFSRVLAKTRDNRFPTVFEMLEDFDKACHFGRYRTPSDMLRCTLDNKRYEIVQLTSDATRWSYRAKDLEHKRDVIIKGIAYAGDYSEDTITTLHDSAVKLLERLPRGCPKIDNVIEEEGRLFVVRPFVAGRTSREIVRQEGQMRLEQAADMVTPLCMAVKDAHKRGMYGLDLHPTHAFFPEGGPDESPVLLGLETACVRHSLDSLCSARALKEVEFLEPSPATASLSPIKAQKADTRAMWLIFNELLTGQHFADNLYSDLDVHVATPAPADMPGSVRKLWNKTLKRGRYPEFSAPVELFLFLNNLVASAGFDEPEQPAAETTAVMSGPAAAQKTESFSGRTVAIPQAMKAGATSMTHAIKTGVGRKSLQVGAFAKSRLAVYWKQAALTVIVLSVLIVGWTVLWPKIVIRAASPPGAYYYYGSIFDRSTNTAVKRGPRTLHEAGQPIHINLAEYNSFVIEPEWWGWLRTMLARAHDVRWVWAVNGEQDETSGWDNLEMPLDSDIELLGDAREATYNISHHPRGDGTDAQELAVIVERPVIEKVVPESGTIDEGATGTIRVVVSDDSVPLRYKYTCTDPTIGIHDDGGPEFDVQPGFDAVDASAGSRQVELEVGIFGDGSPSRPLDTRSFSILVKNTELVGPRIEKTDPARGETVFGWVDTPVTLAVLDAKVDIGEPDYKWFVDDIEQAAGREPGTFEYAIKPNDVSRSRQIRVELSDSGAETPSSDKAEWAVWGLMPVEVKGKPPSASGPHKVGDQVIFGVEAVNTRGGTENLEYSWTVNGQPVTPDSDTAFAFRPDDPGQYSVRVVVKDTSLSDELAKNQGASAAFPWAPFEVTPRRSKWLVKIEPSSDEPISLREDEGRTLHARLWDEADLKKSVSYTWSVGDPETNTFETKKTDTDMTERSSYEYHPERTVVTGIRAEAKRIVQVTMTPKGAPDAAETRTWDLTVIDDAELVWRKIEPQAETVRLEEGGRTDFVAVAADKHDENRVMTYRWFMGNQEITENRGQSEFTYRHNPESDARKKIRVAVLPASTDVSPEEKEWTLQVPPPPEPTTRPPEWAVEKDPDAAEAGPFDEGATPVLSARLYDRNESGEQVEARYTWSIVDGETVIQGPVSELTTARSMFPFKLGYDAVTGDGSRTEKTVRVEIEPVEVPADAGPVPSGKWTVSIVDKPNVVWTEGQIEPDISDPIELVGGRTEFKVKAEDANDEGRTITYSWYIGDDRTPIAQGETYSYIHQSEHAGETLKVEAMAVNAPAEVSPIDAGWTLQEPPPPPVVRPTDDEVKKAIDDYLRKLKPPTGYKYARKSDDPTPIVQDGEIWNVTFKRWYFYPPNDYTLPKTLSGKLVRQGDDGWILDVAE